MTDSLTETAALQWRIFSVAELTERIKSVLERDFSMVWLKGEISNFKKAGSGHLYFTLKDDTAQIGAVMFRGQARHLRFAIEDGLSIVALGRLSVYEPRGTYQIILELIEPKGLGSLQIAFDQLKAKLLDEGLFDPERKRPLPFLPRRVCLVTSPGGAVVHDMLHVLFVRYPNLEVEILPVRVQGAGAAADIVEAIAVLNARRTADVAILARGGGSLEDLQAFNAEPVARAIAGSAIPIVSAVGHETDFTIADFVADYRAPTPTAAAAAVVPDKAQLHRRLMVARLAIGAGMAARIRGIRERLTAMENRLVSPRRRLDDNRIRLDDLAARMERAVFRKVSDAYLRLRVSTQRVRHAPVVERVRFLNERVQRSHAGLLTSIFFQLTMKRGNCQALSARLENVGPMRVLSRGYSITRTLPDLAIVRDAAELSPRQAVEILLARGRLRCSVEGIYTHDPEHV